MTDPTKSIRGGAAGVVSPTLYPALVNDDESGDARRLRQTAETVRTAAAIRKALLPKRW